MTSYPVKIIHEGIFILEEMKNLDFVVAEFSILVDLLI